jgi:predicted GTPase
MRTAVPGTRLAYAATTAAAAVLRFVPLGGCFVLYWVARPKDELLLPSILEIARLRQAVVHRITVGLVGSPSSGKDAANKAIFGIDRGNVNPIAGSTREVEITRLPTATALFVVNTPGLGDVVERVTEEARQVLDHIDVFVYLVNAQGGVQARERADYAMCKASDRPVLVVLNKVDTLREADRSRLLDDTRAKLGATDVIAAAFDPLPELAPAPIGLDEVRGWIRERLVEAGKDPSELPW